MAYYTKVLQPDEKVLAVGRLHWCIYRHALLALLAALVFLVASFWAPLPDASTAVRIVAALVAVMGLLMLLAASIRRRTTEIVVTDRRVIFKRGVFSRHTVEMNLSKIDSVDVDQTLTARLLGYGTLVIHGTGGAIEPLQRIEHPLALRSAIVAG